MFFLMNLVVKDRSNAHGNRITFILYLFKNLLFLIGSRFIL